MKRILSLALVLCMAFSLCALSACNGSTNSNKEVENIYADFEDFDSYVPTGSEIIGTWKMTSPTTDYEWQFFANTTLHQTKIDGDVSMSTVCTYNYDGEGNLKVYVFTAETEAAYTVAIDGKTLTLTDAEGEVMTFTKK